ncbi:PQQ-binding-like beta-propeller repeat protein [Haloarcula nitratireducens]|uniref:PQQ-binding-like beta-propeller repeat protein n=1 Tax=Haloarcula nitratireducens TaxID=2487749 RepID=A0AAW4PKJ0_9EURY|nr:PQQ-binding-like beta-propeller repeat protein [Halomicroarcula nitratireducens]MBX0297956.1 PQQ-binding-like beta-propeller repeat protein [Halomicroarcula nitratireducens]
MTSVASAGAALPLLSGEVAAAQPTCRNATTTLPADAWPTIGHDAGRTYYNPGTSGPQTGVSERWTTSIPTREFPTIAEGRAYIGGASLRALDVDDGSQTWARSPPNCRYTTPAIGPEEIYSAVTNQNDGEQNVTIQAFDASDGTRHWETDPLVEGESVGVSPPVLVDGTIFGLVRAGQQRSFYAISLDSREVEWRHTVEQPVDEFAVTDGTLVYAVEDGVRAISITDDTVQWAVNSPPVQGLAAASETVVVVSGDSVTALAIGDGTERWRSELGPSGEPGFEGTNSFGQPAIADGSVIIGTAASLFPRVIQEGGATLYKRDLATGDRQETRAAVLRPTVPDDFDFYNETPFVSYGWGRPAVSSDTIFIPQFGSIDGGSISSYQSGLVAIDRETFQVQWTSTEVPSVPVIVAEDRLFATSTRSSESSLTMLEEPATNDT